MTNSCKKCPINNLKECCKKSIKVKLSTDKEYVIVYQCFCDWALHQELSQLLQE